MRHFANAGLALLMLLVCVEAACGRTITLTAEDCDRMAICHADAPRVGWGIPLGGPAFNSHTQLTMASNMTVLLRYPLDKIPKDQKILKAEWTIPYGYTAGVKQRLYARRILADWGTGACHDYRMTFPKKVPWGAPGARAANTDRAAKTTAIFEMLNSGESTADVTEDVDLWYTGAARNRGWVLTLDDTGSLVYLTAPYPPAPSSWRLTITFEPN